MNQKRQLILLQVFAVFALASANSAAIECLVTKPSDWPAQNAPTFGDNLTWYGSSSLAALVPDNGHWKGVGKSYSNKFWWWREGFSAIDEPKPRLKVIAQKLDGDRDLVIIDRATSGMGLQGEWHAMLIGMYFPSPGCWEVRGSYAEKEELTLVLKVGGNDDT